MLESMEFNAPTVVLLALVAVLAVFAFRRAVRSWSGTGGCHGEGGGERRERRVKVSDTDESHYPYRFEIPVGGMTCENCARRVENAINRVGGTWARVDVSSGTATVLAKEDGLRGTCEDAVQKAGYFVMGRRP